jgi:hypothetical protein
MEHMALPVSNGSDKPGLYRYPKRSFPRLTDAIAGLIYSTEEVIDVSKNPGVILVYQEHMHLISGD